MPGNTATTTTATAKNNNQHFAYNKYLLCTTCYAMKHPILMIPSWRMYYYDYYYYYSPSGR